MAVKLELRRGVAHLAASLADNRCAEMGPVAEAGLFCVLLCRWRLTHWGFLTFPIPRGIQSRCLKSLLIWESSPDCFISRAARTLSREGRKHSVNGSRDTSMVQNLARNLRRGDRRDGATGASLGQYHGGDGDRRLHRQNNSTSLQPIWEGTSGIAECQGSGTLTFLLDPAAFYAPGLFVGPGRR